MKKNWCLVSTSFAEGFPNIIAESMLLGLPVIATKAGETELITGSSEFLTINLTSMIYLKKF